jgi:hypothetical protein
MLLSHLSTKLDQAQFRLRFSSVRAKSSSFRAPSPFKPTALNAPHLSFN